MAVSATVVYPELTQRSHRHVFVLIVVLQRPSMVVVDKAVGSPILERTTGT